MAATDALAALYKLVADRKDFPVVRAGLHHGSALFRGNRHFASTVNIAARTAAQAIGGEILCTEGVAENLIQLAAPGIEVQHRGLASLRNLPSRSTYTQSVWPAHRVDTPSILFGKCRLMPSMPPANGN